MGIFQRAGYEIADTVTGGELDGAIEMGLDDLYANTSVQIEKNGKAAGLSEEKISQLQTALGTLTQEILPGIIKNNAASFVGEDVDVESKAMELLVKEYPNIKDKLKDEGIELDGQQLQVLKQSLVAGGEETGQDLDDVEANVDMGQVVPGVGGPKMG